ncbi:PhnD/SsuA/transferrin family substrate-binding protein [Nostoc sp. BAE]|nr:PhnD/SsuA/transferrin family substrate-binding protein [Nostoc commune BAE]MBG1262363.1 PhnD/SsuA/transferrin family substrate-binding protein [Nostoc commune BAE]
MGFAFREAFGSSLHQIDALLVMEPGVFVCLEAKGYKGKWTGSANETWFSDNKKIEAVGGNPYIQVERYSLVIKDKLRSCIFQDIPFWVNYFVVAPDTTKFEIEGAVINTFQAGRSVQICHVSKIQQVLGSIRTRENVAAKFNEVGIKKIISELTGISLEKIERLINVQSPDYTTVKLPVESPKLKPVGTTVEPPPKKDTIPVGTTVEPPHNKYIHFSKILSCFVVVGAGIFAILYYFNQTPCETATETRVNSICYKDITKKPLIVGIVTSPKQYSEFKTYLKKQLGSQAIDVVVEGNSEITYKEAQNNISTNKWDIVFANSPMNGMRAKDNSYKWLVRMFPKYLLSYQSALFVISDSSIKSIKDINSTTTIALGDFNSASSFYMPTYDLYGKSMTVTAGHRSSKIRELVANKQADIGAVVYTTIKDDPQFRVIQISREIPGTGVYLSPKLTPTVQKQIQNILENAPKKIKEQANYDIGKEPDYKQFRTIALRVDQVLSCANFSRNPVQFFCNATSQGILGRVAGFTNQGNGTIRLRLERENHKTCQVFVSSQTLNKITDGSSPEIINRKQVNIIGVEPIELEEGTCQLTIENPTQLVVLQPGA